MFPKTKILWSPASLHSPHTHHVILSPSSMQINKRPLSEKGKCQVITFVSDAASDQMWSEWAGLAGFNPQIRLLSVGLPSVIRTHHVVFQWVPLSVTDGPPRMNSATIRKTFCFGFIYPKSVKMKQIKTSYVLGNETWKQSSGKRRWASRFRVISNKFS